MHEPQNSMFSPDHGWPTSLQQGALNTLTLQGAVASLYRRRGGLIIFRPTCAPCTGNNRNARSGNRCCGEMQQSMPTSLSLHMGASHVP